MVIRLRCCVVRFGCCVSGWSCSFVFMIVIDMFFICCIGVMIGGGDVFGLNVVLCVVICVVLCCGWDCVGICDGYDGLL